MARMHGGELFQRIEEVECFTEDDAIHIITQVARGIKYLHDNGIVHRDIKVRDGLLLRRRRLLVYACAKMPVCAWEGQPENLVFSNKTLTPLKLCDFGLSKVLDGTGMTDTPCGTVGYLAPEIAKEQAHNFGVDIWGLGCVLYSLYGPARPCACVRPGRR
jgi:serine/threonine-protein kinase RCK2